MLDYIDRKFKLDVQITFIATFISIAFITSTFIWDEQALHILSILVILLPVIYVIGNLIIREIIDRRVKTLINIVISHEKYKDYKKLEKGWMRYYGLCKRVKLNTYRTEKEVKQIK